MAWTEPSNQATHTVAESEPLYIECDECWAVIVNEHRQRHYYWHETRRELAAGDDW